MNANERPVNLDLTKFAFPLPALASITHRVTGVVLFVGIAFMLVAFDRSVSSEAGYQDALAMMATPFGRFVTWGLLTALGYHLLAGIKHLFLDWDVGDTLAGARLGAQLVISGSVFLSLLAGVWVW